jgi:hypothetical protein
MSQRLCQTTRWRQSISEDIDHHFYKLYRLPERSISEFPSMDTARPARGIQSGTRRTLFGSEFIWLPGDGKVPEPERVMIQSTYWYRSAVMVSAGITLFMSNPHSPA